jgi:4-hydroxy-tetrahydrodipicolinate synthase
MVDANPGRARSEVERRTVLGAAAMAAIGCLVPASGRAEDGGASDSGKAWARERLRGGESFILPSMTPDFAALDEEGIRRDVRHAVRQGFCSILPLSSGLDRAQARRMREIVAEEARGKIFMVGTLGSREWSRVEEAVRAAEALGTSHVLLSFNSDLPTQEAMYQEMKALAERTSMRIILYAQPDEAVTRLDPTGLPLEAFDRLADLDNVVGVKFTQLLRPAAAFAVAERLGGRLLLGVVDLEMMLPLSLKHSIQWTGQWAIDCLQSPETPWVGQYLELLRQRKLQEAYSLYWKYEPAATAFYRMQAPSLAIGGHPWMHIKYMKWLTGGNGGLLPDLKASRDHVPHLDAAARASCRQALDQVGIRTVDLPDEAFVVGNAAYERGVRARDLRTLPQYTTE